MLSSVCAVRLCYVVSPQFAVTEPIVGKAFNEFGFCSIRTSMSGHHCLETVAFLVGCVFLLIAAVVFLCSVTSTSCPPMAEMTAGGMAPHCWVGLGVMRAPLRANFPVLLMDAVLGTTSCIFISVMCHAETV